MVILGCFWAYAGQPHNHIGWATSMPFASINPTNPRTNPWNFHKKILRIGGAGKWPFFRWPIWFFFFWFFFFFLFLKVLKIRQFFIGKCSLWFSHKYNFEFFSGMIIIAWQSESGWVSFIKKIRTQKILALTSICLVALLIYCLYEWKILCSHTRLQTTIGKNTYIISFSILC